MNGQDAQVYELDRVDQIRAARHKYAPPAGWCQYCCAPPDALYGCVACRRPPYAEVVGPKYRSEL